jgi:MFS family permease
MTDRFKENLSYGWIAVIVLFIIAATLHGFRVSFGIFFQSIASEFRLTRGATSGVFSVYVAFGCLFSVLAGWGLDRYGPRIILFIMGLFTGFSLIFASRANAYWQLLIAYSLFLSIGTGSTYVVTMSTISKRFNKSRGLALGITSSGAGLGAVLIAPFATYLISSFGWRKSYVIMGLIGWLVTIPLSQLLRNAPSEIATLSDEAKVDSTKKVVIPELNFKTASIESTKIPFRDAVTGRNFYLLGVIWGSYAFCTYLVFTHIVIHIIDNGISAKQAALVISLIGGAGTVGRIALGIASDRFGIKTTAISCSLLQAAAMLWLIWIHSIGMFYLFAIIYGFANGGFVPASTSLAGSLCRAVDIGKVFGLLDIGWGIGAALGPAAGGLIFDITNSYVISFLIAALIMFLAALFLDQIRQTV